MKFNNRADQIIYEKGYEAYQNDEYMVALEAFQIIYQENQLFELNYLIVNCLINMDEFEEAEVYINECLSEYISDASKRFFAANIFINMHKFMSARKFAIDDQIVKSIEHAEEAYKEKHFSYIAKLESQFAHIAVESNEVKTITLEKAKYLPLSAYLDAAKNALKDKYLSPFYKTNILIQLFSSNVNGMIEETFLDEFITIDLENLTMPTASRSYIKAVAIANEEFSNQDPVKFQQIISEIDFQSLFLFPKIDEIIDDPQVWIDFIKFKLYGEKDLSKHVGIEKTIGVLNKVSDLEQTFLY